MEPARFNPNHWYVGARSEDLPDGKPLARTLLDRRIAIYRADSGSVRAVEDRCPHKFASLSRGRVVGNEIECPYHGWRIEPDRGSVTVVPCASPNEKLPFCTVKTYPAIEQDGWIWLWMNPDAPPNGTPPRFPRDPDHRWFELHNVMEASADLILENGVDCSHTGILHEGLFRSAPSAVVRAEIRQNPEGVVIETFGETNPHRRDVKSWLTGGAAVSHTDTFFAPNVIVIDYRFESSRFVTILVCTPETTGRTRVYTRIGTRFRWFDRLLGWFVRRVTEKVVAQDKVILEDQERNIRREGHRDFRTVTADLPSVQIITAYRQFHEGVPLWGGEPRTRSIEYKL